MFDPETKKELIMEHYTHPLNRLTVTEKDFIKVNTNSDSCIDNIDLFVKIEDGIIKDMYFNGEACAISTSATSIMTKLLKGKTSKEVRELIKEYYAMIEGQEHNEELLEEAICYDEIYKQENRKGCATIPWRGIEKALNEYESKK